MKRIDLRSDTVTQPGPAMREAMHVAETGDDVYGEDPTVNDLQFLAAEITGTEAALFLPSGTQSNLTALLSHCQRGEEYIVAQSAHTYRYEGGGAAVLGSIQPQPLECEPDGTLALDKVASVIKADDPHFAITRLLCLENTIGGKVLPLAYLTDARRFVDRHGLNLHLDGARVFNAATRLAIDVREIIRHFDSVSVCLSKGLGAPVGSVLCGGRAFIQRAHRWRKMLGGGMRQAGVLAAAGIYALENHLQRLTEDHDNARRLADGLAEIDALKVDSTAVQTNMVFVSPPADSLKNLISDLGKKNIIISNDNPLRLVTHLDIDNEDIDRVISACKTFYL